RDIDPLDLDALLVGAARSYFVGPEGQTARVRLAIEKIVVVFGDEEAGLVDRIRSRAGVVVVDGYRGRCGSTQIRARRTTEADAEILRPFSVRVVDDEDRNRLGTLTGSKTKCADAGDIITPRRRVAIKDVAVLRAGAVAGRIIHRRLATRAPGSRDVQRNLQTRFADAVRCRAKLDTRHALVQGCFSVAR